MTSKAPLGIQRIEAIHYYVHDLERSRRFYSNCMDYVEVAKSDERLTEGGHQRSVVFEAGACRVVCSSPVGDGGRADRFLRKHPDGVGSLVFEVSDIEHCFSELECRGGTPITDIETTREGEASFRTFSITTPFGDTTFRFVERRGGYELYPGLRRTARDGGNAFGFRAFDHVTANFETMSPTLLWLEHVLGFERFWDVEFHTDDVAHRDAGSGLRSVVMYDPKSATKFACNEPYRPNFKESQINVFHEQHRGDGVQHVALSVDDIVTAVRGLRARGVEFMPTPASYYELLPGRLKRLGISELFEPLSTLEELEILVDGHRGGGYLLQIFLKDSAGLYGSPEAGPFFYEIIQRRGDQGFGAGNFRALFESIEREQRPGPPPADQGQS
ncbi:MAG TPA: VOC family protein [Polyangiaceae bacterium]|jgi:4-hydroxyphenylpyruvate dioxygenase